MKNLPGYFHPLFLIVPLLVFLSGTANAQQIGSLMQGANGQVGSPNDPVEWITGNINPTKGHFIENMSIPYRLVLEGLQPGQSYCITLRYDTRTKDKSAIDFLTSYDRAADHEIFGHTAEKIDPLLGTVLEGRNLIPQRVPIPVPSGLNTPVPGQPAGAFNALPLSEREMTIFNGSIVSIGYVAQESLGEARASSSIQICFWADRGNGAGEEQTVILAWGGHIAQQEDWGTGNTSAGDPGNPYDMRIADCSNLIGCGSRTLTVQGAAVSAAGDCTISGPASICGSGTFEFAALGEDIKKFSWEISDNTADVKIKGPKNKRTVEIQSDASGGAFELQLTIDGTFSCTKRIIVISNEAASIEKEEEVICVGETPAPVTWSTEAEPTVVRTFILANDAGEVLASEETSEALFTQLPSVPGDYFVYGIAYPESFPECIVKSGLVKITVAGNPVADFQADPVCIGSETVFINTSQAGEGNLSAYFWDFGDGAQSSEAAPRHVYAAPGSYVVQLSITDENQCSATTERTVEVYDQPEADFSAQAVCLGLATAFEDLSQPGGSVITEWYWDFGDGANAVLQNPEHVFELPGVYNVSLTITDQNGCSDTVEKEVEVYDPPKPDLTAENLCEGDEVVFSNLSQPGSAPIVLYEWTLGDGTTSNETAPVHLYGEPGIYPVTLKATDENGCFAVYETELEIYARAAADAGEDEEICQGGSLQLSGTVSGISGGSWSDNGVGGIFSPGPETLDAEYTPPANFAGEIILTLTTRDPEGPCPTESDDLALTVHPLVRVSAGADISACLGDEVPLSGTISGSDIGGVWSDNGAGGTFLPDARALDAVYIPPAGSVNDILLTLTSDDPPGPCSEKSDELRLQIFYNPRPAFETEQLCDGKSIQFVNKSHPGSRRVLAWEWQFGDGTTSNEKNPLHAFPGPGTYEVILKVTNTPGCVETVTQLVTVAPPPVPFFTVESFCAGAPVVFTNTSQVSEGLNATYEWDFGDGGVSNEKNPEHTYQSEGSYFVRLKVTDDNGCSTTLMREITINKGPVAGFEAEPVCVGSEMIFNNISQAGGAAIQTYSWDFGDGTGSSETDPRHTYEAAGTYSVMLTLIDEKGCSSEIERNVVVFDQPVADFNALTVCLGQTTLFQDFSTTGDASITEWQWDFGDGETATSQNPEHLYELPGRYLVGLTVNNEQGCSDVIEKEIVVNDPPHPGFTAENVCDGDEMIFVNVSEAGDAPIVIYEWQFGDGQGSLLAEPGHVYASPGLFTVVLTAVDENGCTASFEKEVQVYEKPVAAFEADPVCLGETVRFRQLSEAGAGALKTYEWDFGDGQRSTLPSPEYRYTESGAYPVVLTVTDEYGCTATFRAPAVVYPPASADAGEDREICEDGELQLSGRVGGVAGGIWSDNGAGGGFQPNSNSLTPTYTPPAGFSGEILLTLTSGDPEGPCGPVSDDLLLTVRPRIEVSAGDDLDICGATPVKLNGKIKGDNARGTWSDNGIGGLFEPNHLALDAIYSPPSGYRGEIILTLSANDAEGLCGTIEDELKLKINEPVIVNAGLDASLCVGQTYQLNGQISGGVTAGSWSDGGAGGTFLPNAEALNASYTPPAGFSGNISLKLISVKPSGACPAVSDDLELKIFEKPVPAFQAEVVCDGQPVQFENNSRAGTNKVSSWSWDFGDGETSSEKEPSHLFPGPGVYEVILTVTNDRGCQESMSREVIIYARPNPLFFAEVSCPGDPVVFTNFSEVAEGLEATYEWDFGDGQGKSTEKDPVYTYSLPGSYMVRLKVTDENGCSTTLVREITLREGPTASFEADPVCAGSPMIFINTSQASEAAIRTYEWDYGDGDYSTGANPQHVYADAGDYTVRLLVTDNNGCSDQFSQEVKVFGPPVVDFSFEDGCDGQSVQFLNLSEGKDAPLAGYLWRFGDGASSTQADPEHKYAGPGEYEVTLEVTDENGCTADLTRTVRVSSPPQAAFSALEACAGQPVSFSNKSEAGNRPMSHFEWQFGDGGRSDEVNPTHAYGKAGTYDVVLTAFDEGGCSQSFIGSVTVLALPLPDFAVAVSCETGEATFTDRSEMPGGEIVDYRWKFNDRQSSLEKNPSFVFPGPGTYPVTLEVINDRGCRTSVTREVVIPESPVADFSVADACVGGSPVIQVVNNSRSAGGESVELDYLWMVRDNRDREVARSREENPGFDLAPGAYRIELEVSDGLDCNGYTSREVTVFEDPGITIEAVAERICEGEGTTLTAQMEGGMDCTTIEWQLSGSPRGPWKKVPGAGEPELFTGTDLPAGSHFYRAVYRCSGANCDEAVSNMIEVEVGAGTADLACVEQVNVVLRSDCTVEVLPDMVSEGAFGHCIPYREEDFEVLVFDFIYPGGSPDNVVEAPGLYTYRLQLKPEAESAGGIFTPCEGQILVSDGTPPELTCPADVAGILSKDETYRPALKPAEAQPGETFNFLICSDFDRIYREERSWTDPDYPYYTGLPVAEDACGTATLVRVEDEFFDLDCDETALDFGGQIERRILRKFTYKDEHGNAASCDQTIYFFRPRIQLPDCVVSLDLCTYPDPQDLDPAETETGFFYRNGLGERFFLTDYACGFSVAFSDDLFEGPPNCGFKVRRTWIIVDDCRSEGLEVDLIDLPATSNCEEKPEWRNDKFTFVQTLVIEDAAVPVVSCPDPANDNGYQIYSTEAGECAAIVSPPAPSVSGECRDWTWSFDLYGYVVDPRTQIPQYKLIGTSRDQSLEGVEPGEYDLIYKVTDACGNEAVSEKCKIRVEDRIDPVAVCEDELRISLGSGIGNANGVATVTVSSIGVRSYDNCGEVSLDIRRIIDETCLDSYVMAVLGPDRRFSDLRREEEAGRIAFYNGQALFITYEEEAYYSAWDQSVYVSCCDISESETDAVVVELRATDEAGNTNFCWSDVFVEDRLAPRCSVEDVVIACTDLDFNPRSAVDVAARFGAPEAVVNVFDNCGATISEELSWTPANCGRGILERIFTVTDASGQSSFCTQVITVEGVVDYEVILPGDNADNSCGEAAGEEIYRKTFGCDMLSISQDTLLFDGSGGGCHRLMINYEVINWCEYDATGNTTPTRIPRDVDNDDVLTEPTWIRVAYDETFDEVVTKIYGAKPGGERREEPSRILRPGDRNYNPGYFSYTQFIDVLDQVSPVVDILTEDLDFCTFDSGECEGRFEIRMKVTDNCPLSTVQLDNLKLLDGNSLQVPADAGLFEVTLDEGDFVISGALPVDLYRLTLRFSDGCGNPVGATLNFSINDCKSPGPVCRGILSPDLMPVDTDGDGRADGGAVTLPVEAFIASEITDCSPFADEPLHQVKYFLSRYEPVSVNELTEQSIVFTCADEGVNDVYLIALDAAGNFDYCLSKVVIDPGNDPNPCQEPSGNGLIGGLISTEDDDPVEDVMVRLSGQMNASVVTDATGMYGFTGLEEGYDFSVVPLLDRDYVNGVTTFDLLQINEHILATDPLDSPYEMIAADATNDKRITSFDLIQFRKLILTLIDDLPDNTSWRFVARDFNFPDPANPWATYFPELINVNNLEGAFDRGDFVAVKIGDINGNARTTRLMGTEIRSEAGVFTLKAADHVLEAGNTYEVAFTAEDLINIAGYQFTLEWDLDEVELIDLKYGLATEESFGIFPGEGALTTSWINQLSADEADRGTLFTLVLRARKDQSLSQALRITSRYTAAEAYNGNREILGVTLGFTGETVQSPLFELLPNRPNPWQDHTLIGFTLPEPGEARLTLMDVNGRILRYLEGQFEMGYNEIRLEKGNLPTGVLYYVLESAGHTATRKMVVLE